MESPKVFRTTAPAPASSSVIVSFGPSTEALVVRIMTLHDPVPNVAAVNPLRAAPDDLPGGRVDLGHGGQVAQGRHRDLVPPPGRVSTGRAVPRPVTAADRNQDADRLRLASWETDGGRVGPVLEPAFFTSPTTSVVGRRCATAKLGGRDTAAKRSDPAKPAGAGVPPSSTTDTGLGGAPVTRTDKAALAEVRQALDQAKGGLMHEHHEVLEDPRYGVEGLEGAGCGPYIKDLARLAIGADTQGLTAEDWRAWVVEGLGPDAAPLLDSAEGCMRASGLWPWPT